MNLGTRGQKSKTHVPRLVASLCQQPLGRPPPHPPAPLPRPELPEAGHRAARGRHLLALVLGCCPSSDPNSPPFPGLGLKSRKQAVGARQGQEKSGLDPILLLRCVSCNMGLTGHAVTEM